MKTTVIALVAGAMLAGSAQADVNVGVGNSASPWLGFMNVFNTPEDGGAFQFPSGWGVADLRATFDDANSSVTMLPNTIGDPNEYWYDEAPGGDPGNPNNGGPGAPGNKIMEANLYQEVNDTFAGQLVTFSGFVTAFSLTDAHEARVFIRDFAPDYSSLNETIVEVSSTGAFSISLLTDAGAGRHVQWGFQLKGVNVWFTDADPFGSITYSSVPAPTAAGVLALGGLFAARRRR